MWHCPHCGAPQAETARCWVCRKSSTTCSTCRHFRLSLSAEVGWCALDAKRKPLTGLEQRGCWQERPAAADALPLEIDARAGRSGWTPAFDEDIDAEPALDFVPVELLRPVVISTDPALPKGEAPEAVAPPLPELPADVEEPWSERTSLFGELEG